MLSPRWLVGLALATIVVLIAMVSLKFSKIRLALICHLHEYGSGMRVRHHFRETAALCRPVSQFID